MSIYTKCLVTAGFALLLVVASNKSFAKGWFGVAAKKTSIAGCESALLERAKLLYRFGQYGEALSLLTKVEAVANSSKASDNTLLARAQIVKAVVLSAQDEREKAKAILDKAEAGIKQRFGKSHSLYASLLTARGISAHASYKKIHSERYLKQAIGILEKTNSIAPVIWFEALEALAKVMLNDNRPRQAHVRLQQAIKRAKKGSPMAKGLAVEAMVFLAMRADLSKERDKSERLLFEAIELSRSKGVNPSFFARAATKTADYLFSFDYKNAFRAGKLLDSAINSLKGMEADDPGIEYIARYTRAMVAYVEGKLDLAQRQGKWCLRWCEKNGKGEQKIAKELFLLGRYYLVAKKYDEATEVLRRAVSLNIREGLTKSYQLYLAYALHGAGKHKEAEKQYGILIAAKTKRNSVLAMVGLAYLAAKTQNMAKVKMWLKMARKQCNDKECLIYIANAYHTFGDTALAKQIEASLVAHDVKTNLGPNSINLSWSSSFCGQAKVTFASSTAPRMSKLTKGQDDAYMTSKYSLRIDGLSENTTYKFRVAMKLRFSSIDRYKCGWSRKLRCMPWDFPMRKVVSQVYQVRTKRRPTSSTIHRARQLPNPTNLTIVERRSLRSGPTTKENFKERLALVDRWLAKQDTGSPSGKVKKAKTLASDFFIMHRFKSACDNLDRAIRLILY